MRAYLPWRIAALIRSASREVTMSRGILSVGPTRAITCEAHIDDARVMIGHLQPQRFDRFIALFGSRPGVLRIRPFPGAWFRIGLEAHQGGVGAGDPAGQRPALHWVRICGADGLGQLQLSGAGQEAPVR
jgi:hypothetical protein